MIKCVMIQLCKVLFGLSALVLHLLLCYLLFGMVVTLIIVVVQFIIAECLVWIRIRAPD